MNIASTHQNLVVDDEVWNWAPFDLWTSDKMLYFLFSFPLFIFKSKGNALIFPCCVIASKSERWCELTIM